MRRLTKWMAMTLLADFTLFGQEPTGPQVIKRVNELMNPQSSWAKSKMVIQTSTGQDRTFVYESWSLNQGEKNLIRYLKPNRVKGQATLMTNFSDDIWMYFPRTKRVRKLATHAKKQKMEGSDFSYEDMGSGDSFARDYLSNRLEDRTIDEVNCYQVELVKKPDTDISYSRLIMFVRKDNFVPIRIEYYDEKDAERLMKVLIQSDIRVMDSIPTGMKIVMENKVDNSRTLMELLEVKYNLPLDETMFTERGLKQ